MIDQAVVRGKRLGRACGLMVKAAFLIGQIY
jgi:hypothetical protein